MCPELLVEAVVGDDRLRVLRALRDRLAVDLDGCRSLRDVASLSQRLMDVLVQIEALTGAASAGKPERGTGLSEFEARLAERQSGAAGAGRAPRG